MNLYERLDNCQCGECRALRRRAWHLAGVVVLCLCLGAALGGFFTANWIFAQLP